MNGIHVQSSSTSYFKSNFNQISAYNGNDISRQLNVSPKDSIKISRMAYELQSNPKATSGKDELNITKSSDKFVIHFDNSAILNRTVQRGYLEVNGYRLSLSDEVKKKLLSTGEKVKQTNEQAFMSAIMEHESAVFKQQTDAFKKMGDKQSRTMQTASRIMQGKKVSQQDEQELMRTNPELYLMAKSAAMLKKHKHITEDKDISKQNEQARIKESQPQDYSTDFPEYEQLETQMTLSFNESELEIYSITSGTVES